MLSGTGKNGKGGVKPVDLLSMSLASCMAQSIIYYFQKNNQQLDDFEVHIKSRMKKDVPWSATDFHLTLNFWGKELSDGFVAESIKVSEEELCGVTDVLKHSRKITNEYKIYRSEGVQII